MSGLAVAVAAASVMAAAGLAAVEPAQAAVEATSSHHAVEQFQLAEGQEFWGNVLRYGRYFVTVMLGTGYVMLRPLAGAFKNPVSGVLAVAGVVGSVVLVKVTLEAMLGINEIVDPLVL